MGHRKKLTFKVFLRVWLGTSPVASFNYYLGKLRSRRLNGVPMLVTNLSDPEYSSSVFMGLCSKLIISTSFGGKREGGWAADSPLSSEFQREVVVMVVVYYS